MADEVSRTDVIVLLGMPVITLVDTRQQAYAVGGDDELVGLRKQGVARALGKRPGNRILDIEVQGDAQVGVKMPLNVEIRAVRDGQVDIAHRDPAKQVGSLGVGVLGPCQLGVFCAERL